MTERVVTTELLEYHNNNKGMAANVIVIAFPFTKVETDKKTGEGKLNEVIQAVCALLNSNGGILKLYSGTKENFNFDKLVRKVEQRIKELVGCFKSCKKFEVLSNTSDANNTEVVFGIASSEEFCTVNYHLYLPQETQVNLIAPTEPLQNVRSILTGPRLIECEQLVQFGSHRKNFIEGENIGAPESKTEQFKKVKCEATRKVSLADRIVSKHIRFACFVSAYANHRGGHIYYGIKDDGTVEGEILGQNDKENITAKVNKTICKMLWPINAPQRGKHWDIFFEPVYTESRCKQIPSTFVVVVTVVQSAGGVFADKPESYRVVNGKAEAFPFEIWKKRVLCATSESTGGNTSHSSRLHWFANRRDKVPTGIARHKGGATKLEQSCLQSRQRLARFRNNGNKTGFEKYAQELANQPDCFNAIVWQQRAACKYRESHFDEAYEFLQRSKSLLVLAHENHPVLEMENLYWESLVSRGLGNYEECESYRVLGMQRMESCPPDIISAWFFFQEARAMERLIFRNPNQMSKLIPQARLCYVKALRLASMLDESTSVAELKQRCHTRLALLNLGCFFHENEITRTQEVVQHDIEEAERMLKVVDWSSRVQGWPLTEFCRCEFLLARAQQNIRNWQQLQDECYLELAQEESSRALDICEKKNFQEMMNFVNAELHEINAHLNM